MKPLFTERTGAAKPRIYETLTTTASSALWTLLKTRLNEEWFGYRFPDRCGDGYPYAGTDHTKLAEALMMWGVSWPEGSITTLIEFPDPELFDLIEFAYEHVAQPGEPSFHSYMGHSHYSYDVDAGRAKFAEDVNRIFARNGIAYELEHGEIIRPAPAVLHESLAAGIFNTDDQLLDEILQAAREKFLNRSLPIRREALEKLWDAWERLKTVLPGKDKKAGVAALLDAAATEPVLRKRLEDEAIALTQIGNTFMIRHAETDKIPVKDSIVVDYLFHRMFSLIQLLLKASALGA